MLADKHTYDVAITKPDGTVMMSTALAESKWEAEDRKHTELMAVQPDRGAYSARRNYAKVRQQVGGVL
jgi:hypothetical protein